MSFYQITYKFEGEDRLYDDYIREDATIAEAEWYAKHRVDGSYGETSMRFVNIKHISRAKAQRLKDANAVDWTNTLL